MKKTLISVLAVVAMFGCSGEVDSPLVTEPTGQILWTRSNGERTTVDLSGNYSGQKDHFAGSVATEAGGKIHGKIEWEFVAKTRRFGDAILDKLILPGEEPLLYVLESGRYHTIYQDDEHVVEYTNK